MKQASLLLMALYSVIFGACRPAQEDEQGLGFESATIITAGSTVSEIVCALGYCDQIIATDLTSSYPAQLQDLPSIGYRNQIKAEGLLSLGPSLIIAETGYINADVVTQIKAAGIRFFEFEKPTSLAGTKQIINQMAQLLEVEAIGTQLLEQLDDDLNKLRELKSNTNTPPSVAFLLARGPETVFIAGEYTFASHIIEMAGATSAGQGFEDFVPLTPEAINQMNPSYIILFTSGLESLGGLNGLGKVQGVNQTTAYQEGRIIAMDGNFLSSFGPRLGKAALELNARLFSN